MLAIFTLVEHFLLAALDSAWSLVTMGTLAMVDSLVPPLPAGTFVSALGAVAAGDHPAHPLWLIILVAAGGALLGDLLAYRVGRMLRGRPLQRLRSSRRFGTTIARAEKGFDARWPVILSTTRFIPVVRGGVFLAAGMISFPLRRIVILDGIAAIIWANVFALSGYFGGALMSTPLSGAVVGIIVGGMVGLLIARVASSLQKSRSVDKVSVTA